MFWPIDPISGAEGVCKDSIYDHMVLYIPFPLIWYATQIISVKYVSTFWPYSRGRGYV